MMSWLSRRHRVARERSAQLPGFAPAAMDPPAMRAELERYVGALTPESVDEATGHALDRLIDAKADQWDAAVVRDYARFRLDRDLELAEPLARYARESVLYAQAQSRAEEAERALRVTRGALLGEQPDHGASHR